MTKGICVIMAGGRGTRFWPLSRTARPKQWMKNVLVVAAPAAAGVLGQRSVILDTLIAFVAFCLAASGTYFCRLVVDGLAFTRTLVLVR